MHTECRCEEGGSGVEALQSHNFVGYGHLAPREIEEDEGAAQLALVALVRVHDATKRDYILNGVVNLEI